MTLYRLPEPAFDSELVPLLFEIERLRAEIGNEITTPVETYVELHQLFDIVMSVVSARIEGNHTTVYEALEKIPQHSQTIDDQLLEIANISAAATIIDSLDPQAPFTHAFIRQLHEQVVRGLKREGDPKPGHYRDVEVGIIGSRHTPPSHVTIHAEMTALLEFVNRDVPLHQQMMQIAVAHHRFVWLHPFRNGNGRVSRLFTHAMLRKSIFSGQSKRALNPTAVFGNDRAEYISALEVADDVSEDGTTEWVMFFARGIRDDLQRVVKLQQQEHVNEQILLPSLRMLLADGIIDGSSFEILQTVMRLSTVKAGDLVTEIPGTASQRSRVIRNLVDRKLLRQSMEGPRFYHLSLVEGPITSRLIRRLDELGYLPRMLSND